MKRNTLLTILCLFLFGIKQNSYSQCQASFTYTNNGATFNFTNTSNSGLGTILQTLWNFGDGGTSTQLNDSHTYTSCGTYTISLTIFTSAFCTSTITDSVQVSIPINGTFTATVDTTNGNTNFLAQPINLNYNYNWIFGDGSTGTGATTIHTYSNSGNYNACLLITDNSGICSNTVCNNVIVYIANPSCAISFTSQALGGTVAFTPTPFSVTDTYVWNYGDGSPKDTAFIGNHTYSNSGTYVVCVTVTTLQGCTNTFCQNVIVNLTSIGELKESAFNIFPNPAENFILLKSDKLIEKNNISIYTISGEKIETKFLETNSEGLKINLNEIQPGMYFLEIKSDEARKLLRFIKKTKE